MEGVFKANLLNNNDDEKGKKKKKRSYTNFKNTDQSFSIPYSRKINHPKKDVIRGLMQDNVTVVS